MKPIDAVLEILRTEGVERIFGNPGTTELPFMDALGAVTDISYTMGLHEGSVVAMADGYARATRRPAVANLHVAAGVANGLIGIINAARSGTPLVVTAGQQDRRHLLTDPMLSGDLVAMARPWTKSAIEVQHASDLPILLRRAFSTASQPPTGPVLLAIPMDLLEDPADVIVPGRSARSEPGVAGGLSSAVDRLARATNPAIIAGDGVGREDALAEIVAVAEALGAPVYSTPMYDRIDFPPDHPLYGGMPLPTNESIRAHLAGHDVVLIVGARAFMAHHYTPGNPIPDGTTVIQLNDDPGEPGRNFPVAVALVGGIASTLGALADRLTGRVPGADARAARIGTAHAAERAALMAEIAGRPHGSPIDPLRAAHAIASGTPPDATVVEEAITIGVHLRRVLRQGWSGGYAHTIGGGLGWGIGAAIGSRLGDPSRPVIAVLGDGCALFGLQGLWTAAREAVPVLFLIMNNGEYRTLKETLDRRRRDTTAVGTYVGLDLDRPEIDWAAAGATFGIPTRRVASADELCEVTHAVGDLEGPLLVDVAISPHASGAKRRTGGGAP